jgi:hypothetical protein
MHQRWIRRLVNREEHRHDNVSVCVLSRASVEILFLPVTVGRAGIPCRLFIWMFYISSDVIA